MEPVSDSCEYKNRSLSMEPISHSDTYSKEPTDDDSSSLKADSLTIHGLPRIFTSSSKSEKTFWLVMFLFCFLYLATLIIGSTVKYFKYESYLVTSTKPVSEMRFPSITFCNMFVSSSSSYDKQKLNPSKVTTVDEIFGVGYPVQKAKTEPLNFDLFSPGYNKFVQSTPKFCRFGYKEYCNALHFKQISGLSSCLTFNPEGTLFQKSPGMKHGFRLILYVNRTAFKNHTLTNDVDDDENRGVTFVVHEPDEFPQMWSKGVSIELGVHSMVTLKKKVTKLKPAPYPSKCVKNVSDIKLNIFPGSYNTQNCLVSCSVYYCYKHCGSVPASLRQYFPTVSFPNIKIANVDTGECIIKHEEEFYRNKTNLCDCPLPCREVVHDTVISVSKVPTCDKKSYSAIDTTGSFLKISVSYDDLVYADISEEESYSSTELMGEVGGLVGLYLGASLFSIVEIVLVVSLVVTTKFKRLVAYYLSRKRK